MFRKCTLMMFLAWGCLFAVAACADTATAPDNAAAGDDSPKAKLLSRLHKKHDLHPVIHTAIMKLRHAKHELEKAKNETSPHKAKAIEAINAALKELRAINEEGSNRR